MLFWYYDTLVLVCIEGSKMNASFYCHILSKNVLRSIKIVIGDIWTAFKNGATVHRVQYTSNWLDANHVYVLNRPAKLFDLNIVENVLKSFARAVCQNRRQVGNVNDFQIEIVTELPNNSIEYDKYKKFQKSIQRHLTSAIKKREAVQSITVEL